MMATVRFTLLVFFVCLLSACIGGGNKRVTNYYLIEPINYQAIEKTDASLKLEIVDLQLPQYLERFHIAKRVENNQITFSTYHQWGENLRKNLLRALSRNLSVLLNTVDVTSPLSRSASNPDFRVQVYIEKFEWDVDGYVRLAARWQITNGDQVQDMESISISSDSKIDGVDYGLMVNAMSDLFSELSRAIAASIE